MLINKIIHGFVVLFEINELNSHERDRYDESASNNFNADNDIFLSSPYPNQEVDMQTSMGRGSAREKLKDLAGKIPKIGTYRKTNLSIVLPVPPQLDTLYNIIWNNTYQGSIGRTVDFGQSLSDGEYKQALDQAKQAAGRTAAKATIDRYTGIRSQEPIDLITGTMENTYQEALFQGVSNRFIQMYWTLTPRNFREADMIKQITHRFKWAMHPELWEGNESKNTAYWKAPHTFDISFMDLNSGKRTPWIWRISTCALTSMMVNGTPLGEFAVLKDGPLASQTLELSFLELITLNKNNFQPSINENDVTVY